MRLRDLKVLLGKQEVRFAIVSDEEGLKMIQPDGSVLRPDYLEITELTEKKVSGRMAVGKGEPGQFELSA